MIVSLTDRSRHHLHVDTLDDFDLDRLRRYLSEVGITMAQARQLGYRPRVWARYFMGLQASCAAQQCSPILLHSSQRCRPKDWPFEIALVSTTEKWLNEVLVQCGVQRRLLSFYLLKGINGAKLERFFTGRT